ncbi:hypothetical protein AGOR_G00180700 [Albula goreensis]|uniref:Poly [ADP-ribose] polymerase n=1 Tax=Albula goreensis TaxID=1534307 RepID=A0A8T3CUH8_9TELE|nr:hypothetical protein AGOR_G00180700 [Albula goreensis]
MEPPEGHHSVVAQGKTEPDPIMDITVQLDGREVNVPQGQPVEQPDYVNSSFDKSEYVIYKESQCRIRYLVLLKDNN